MTDTTPPPAPPDDWDPGDPVTTEVLEWMLIACAWCMQEDGAVYGPIFERIERELRAARKASELQDRARRLLAAYTSST